MEDNSYPPVSFFRFYEIPHYYGDFVRQLFLATAVLACVVIPIWGNILPFGTLVEVGGALLLVLLAGLTNPHSRWALLYDAVVAGVGTLVVESAAITLYSESMMLIFVAREATAIMLLFAFYYSVKTIRAVSLGKLGKRPMPWEFEASDKTE